MLSASMYCTYCKKKPQVNTLCHKPAEQQHRLLLQKCKYTQKEFRIQFRTPEPKYLLSHHTNNFLDLLMAF
jgi:hypothetical protein